MDGDTPALPSMSKLAINLDQVLIENFSVATSSNTAQTEDSGEVLKLPAMPLEHSSQLPSAIDTKALNKENVSFASLKEEIITATVSTSSTYDSHSSNSRHKIGKNSPIALESTGNVIESMPPPPPPPENDLLDVGFPSLAREDAPKFIPIATFNSTTSTDVSASTGQLTVSGRCLADHCAQCCPGLFIGDIEAAVSAEMLTACGVTVSLEDVFPVRRRLALS